MHKEIYKEKLDIHKEIYKESACRRFKQDMRRRMFRGGTPITFDHARQPPTDY
jgi:hypothetical protein